MEINNNEKIRCPLCGHSFLKSEAGAGCASCPMHKKSCGNAKCPNCGYDFPIISDNGGWLKNLFKSMK